MYAVIDLETTGGNTHWHRITELAVYIHDGAQVVDEYSTLVNPGVRIPPFITQLTGITNDMVADAPPFDAVAHIVYQLTSGCIFVAHNVNFDYHFLRAEFKRLGKDFERPRLCTVRTARKLLPGHASYSLGNICRDLGIGNNARHRAAGDAKATVELLERMIDRHGHNTIGAHIIYQNPFQAYQGLLHSLNLEDVPGRAGILRLLNAAGMIIGQEATGNLQKRALQLVKRKASRQARGQLNLLHDLQAEETGSLLLAKLLVEAEKIAFGEKPEAKNKLGWNVIPQLPESGYIQLNIQKSLPGEVAAFKTKKAAQEWLTGQVNMFGLCRKLLNTKARKCHNNCMLCQHQLGANEYNKLVEQAINSINTQPFSQKLILDKGRHPQEFVVLLEDGTDNWRWGFACTEGQYKSPEELAAFANESLNWSGLSKFLAKLLEKHAVIKQIHYGEDKVAFSGV